MYLQKGEVDILNLIRIKFNTKMYSWYSVLIPMALITKFIGYIWS